MDTQPSRRTLLAAAGASLVSIGLSGKAQAAAPGFPGIDAWINSAPRSMGRLHGRVVLVSFWTRQCINCLHNMPYIKAWYGRYAARGFTIVGVHTPEADSEKSALRTAVARYGIRYLVAQDNGSATWNAWGNQY